MGLPEYVGSLLFFAVSSVYSTRQAQAGARARQEARRSALAAASAARSLDVRPTLSGEPIPMIYGFSYTQGIPVFTDNYHDQIASPFKVTIQGEDLKGMLLVSVANDHDELTEISPPDNSYMIVDRVDMPVIPVGTRNCRRVYTGHSSPGGFDFYDYVCSGDEIPVQFSVWDSNGDEYRIVSATIAKKTIDVSVGYNPRTRVFEREEDRVYYVVQFVGAKPPAGTTLYRDYIEPPVFLKGALTGQNIITNNSRSYAYSSLGGGAFSPATQVGTILIDRFGYRYVVTALTSSRVTLTISPDVNHPGDRDLYFLSTDTELPRSSADLADRPGQEVAPQDSRWAITEPTGQAGKNQFLMLQHVLGLGEMDLIDLTIDDNASESVQYKGTFNSFINPYNQISLYADIETINKRDIVFDSNLEIEEAPLFTGMSYTNSTFKKSLDPEEALVYPGEPRLSFYVSSLRVRSNRTDDVMRELLASAEFHAPFFPAEQVDVGLGQTKLANPFKAVNGAPVAFTKYLYENDVDEYVYMFWGQISTGLTLADRVESVLAGQPGLLFFRNIQGIWKLKAPQNIDTTAIEITDDDILLGSLTTSYPSGQSRLNSLTVNYPNIYKNMSADSITYAPADLLAEDNGVILESNLSPEGVIFPASAERIARWTVTQSRLPTYTMTLKTKWLVLEPGDGLTLKDLGGVRVQTVEITPELTVRVTATQHNAEDWATYPA